MNKKKKDQTNTKLDKLNKFIYKNKKNLLIGLILAILIATSIIFLIFVTKSKALKAQDTEEEITIFTHGSFGSLIGFINFFQVIKDNLAGTKYKKTIHKIRNDYRFYSNQPIMQRGLIKIEPSYNISATNNIHLAAYPILKSYEEIEKQTLKINNKKNHFYTFGWSGLLSQEKRKKEAIRFYNNLSEELEKYDKISKIKILTHSHGGNLTLNLAAVNTVINNIDNIEVALEHANTEDEKEALSAMYKQIKKLPTKENRITKGQKIFDYIPTNKNLKIDELLMFGSPIQSETESFIFNNFFGKIYNIYSEEDRVQDLDVFSTKKNSAQRLQILEKVKKPKNSPQIIQLKIMIDREMGKVIDKSSGKELNLLLTKTIEPKVSDTFLGKLISRNRFGSKKTKDPTHRELWFISWKKFKEHINAPLEYIPSVAFTPLFLNAIEKLNKHLDDLDINIQLTKNKLKIYFFDHKEENQIEKYNIKINRKVIDKIKTNLLKWSPDDLSFTKKFAIIKNYQEQI